MFDPDRPTLDLVLDHTECGWVLQRHGVDYSTNGRRSLRQLCRDHGVDVDVIADEIEEAIRSGAGPMTPDPRSLSTIDLVTFLVERHHHYLRSTLPFVAKLAARIARDHGGDDARLHDLHDAVRTLAETFEPHLDHEEELVFPALAAGTASRETVASILRAMEEEHRGVHVLLVRIRTATDGYRVPGGASNEHATLVRELQVLELDLLRHVHLETHVLMPRFDYG